MNETVTLPRAVVEALLHVPADDHPGYARAWLQYDDYEWECGYCDAKHDERVPGDGYEHTVSCPVRLAQEALARSQEIPHDRD